MHYCFTYFTIIVLIPFNSTNREAYSLYFFLGNVSEFLVLKFNLQLNKFLRNSVKSLLSEMISVKSLLLNQKLTFESKIREIITFEMEIAKYVVL